MSLVYEKDLNLHIMKVVSLVFISVGFVLLGIRADEYITLDWLIVAAIGIIGTTPVPIIFSLTLDKYVFNIRPRAKFMINFFAFNVIYAVNLFYIVASLNMEGYIDISWAVAFIPIYYALIISAVGVVFLIPGLTDPEIGYYRVALTIVVWLLGFTAWIIGTVIYLDEGTPSEYEYIFIPITIATGIHLLAYMRSFGLRKMNGYKGGPFTEEFIVVVTLIPVNIIFWFRSTWATFLPIFALFVASLRITFYWLYKESKFYWFTEPEDLKKSEETN